MQLGAYYAGVAIENSMLGATHACANPLAAHYGTAHGVAISVLLPHVVRWNETAAGARYRELSEITGRAEDLAGRLEWLRAAGGLPRRLAELNVPEKDLATLAEEAAGQWTGGFNPRKLDATGALEIYSAAF
jgi:alcohol dehydrogenase